MDLEDYARQVRQGGKGKALEELARSADGERLLAGVDKKELEKAARAGDMQALGAILKGVLASPEGRRFADQVQKAVQDSGR